MAQHDVLLNEDQLDLTATNAALAAEVAAREDAIEALEERIDTIEQSSDVVAVVATYADLLTYDKSKLKNNDLVKVLVDETHDNRPSYYLYNSTTQAFSYKDSEGPWATPSQVEVAKQDAISTALSYTDAEVATKQDKLTAGDNITIDANNVISANIAGLNKVWTQDNLVAGTDISITKMNQPVIDSNTVALYHFNGNFTEEISGEDAYSSGSYSFVDGKFGNCVYNSNSSTSLAFSQRGAVKAADGSYTIDYWLKGTNFDYGQGWQNLYFNRTAIVLEPRLAGILAGVSITYDNETLLQNWTHVAFVCDVSNNKNYLFLNGKKEYEGTRTSASLYANNEIYLGSISPYTYMDEFRISNVARWTSDFTPFSLPYSASAGSDIYQINNTRDMSGYVAKAGDTMTGTLKIGAGTSYAQATVQDAMQLDVKATNANSAQIRLLNSQGTTVIEEGTNGNTNITNNESGSTLNFQGNKVLDASDKDVAGGVAGLDSSTQISPSVIPYAGQTTKGGIKQYYDEETATWYIVTEA